jgi:peptidoglycan/LPS O-acetylase OafA/YrhL
MRQGPAIAILPPGALRLALAAVVVLDHRGYLWPPFDGLAVGGFFFLSGYWIASLWDATYSRCENPLLTFYVSRAWRIYPVAVAGVVAMLPFAPVGWPDVISNLLVFPLGPDSVFVNPPYWSLAVELQFYAAAPLLLLLLRHERWAAAVLALGAAFWGLFVLQLIGFSLAAWLVPFAVGVLWARSTKPGLVARFAPWGLAVAILIALSMPGYDIDRRLSRLALTLAGVAFAPYLMASVSQRSGKLDRRLGDCAYPLYVLHFPVAHIAGALAISATSLYLVILGAATLALYAIDRPLERARRRFVRMRFDRRSFIARPDRVAQTPVP